MAAMGMMLCSSSPGLLEMHGPNQQQQRFRLKVFFKHKHPEEQNYFCEAAVEPPALGMFWGRLERSISAQRSAGRAGGSAWDPSSPSPV